MLTVAGVGRIGGAPPAYSVPHLCSVPRQHLLSTHSGESVSISCIPSHLRYFNLERPSKRPAEAGSHTR